MNPSLTDILDAYNWNETHISVFVNYSCHQTIYSDHYPLQKGRVYPRIHSFISQRTNEIIITKKNTVTHSYTLSSVTSVNDQLFDKFSVIL